VLLTIKKTAKFLNFQNGSVSSPIGAASTVAPIYWCKQIIKIEKIVSTLNIMVLQCQQHQ
jgi:hypothetical protein